MTAHVYKIHISVSSPDRDELKAFTNRIVAFVNRQKNITFESCHVDAERYSGSYSIGDSE